MIIRDLLQEAYTAMRHNRRRTALTMLGMAWGIATVVMLLAYGDGFGQACANIFANFGTKLVIVVPGKTSMQAGGQKSGAPVRFTQEDVETLATNLPQVTHITGEVSKQSTNVQYENRDFTFPVSGNDPNVFDIRSLKLDQGRVYNMEDQVQRGRVAVIGSEAKEKLFSGRNALGERIRLDGISFEVVGVLAAKMQEGNDDINRVVYVPFSTMSDLKSTHYLDTIWFNYQTPEYQKIEPAVRSILAGQHKFNESDREAVRVFNVQKALGARRRYILMQFLAEALTITFMGGVLGVLLAYIVALSVGRLTLYSAFAKNGEAGDIRLIIQPATLIASTVILGAVGLISGMIPAFRASRLDPIESLRHE